jgi:hypothetical protein
MCILRLFSIFVTIYPSLHAYVVTVGSTIESIGRTQWDKLVTTKTSPFCEYDWIYCLEKSGYNTYDMMLVLCLVRIDF